VSPAPDFRSLPKVELHCHLDACVRVETVVDVARETGVPLPADVRAALIAPEVCADLADFLRRLELALAVMQRPQDLERIARELVEDFAADGVIYGEVRFAPQLHGRRGMSPQQAVDAVDAGLVQGRERTGVETGLILCALRHRPAAEGRMIAELAAANFGRVCALDLSGDEGGHPEAAPHAPAFEVARRAGLRLTAHAGENAGASSIHAVLDVLGVERIGHGVRIEEDPELVERVRAGAVSLDMCPRSNVQTRAVAHLADHPIDRLFRRGLRVTVSTDGRTTSDTSVTKELGLLAAQFGWGMAEALACQRHAAEAAFVSERRRQDLLSRLDGSS
jgi:adenosine deaminase